MNIKHAAGTTLAVESKAPSDLAAACPNLAGARFIKAEHDNDPDLYKATDVDHFHKILDDSNEDTAALHIHGTTEEQIVSELMNRHPCDCPGGTFVHVVQGFERKCRKWHEATRYNSGYYSWESKTIKYAWVILKKPYVARLRSVERAVSLTQTHGPIFVHEDVAAKIFGGYNFDTTKKELEKEGFTSVNYERLGLVQINYNPAAFDLRVYRQEVKEYERLTALPDNHVMWQMYKSISPHEWPSQHPFYGTARGRDLHEKPRGWGNSHSQKEYVFDLHEVMAVRDLTLKLWPKHNWWRDSSMFKQALRSAVEHIRGVEQSAHEAIADEEAKNRKRYANYETDAKEVVANPALFPNMDHWTFERTHSRVRTFEEFCGVRWKPDHAVDQLRFCRWLRREAKACKMTVPPLPVKPIPPGQRKKHGKKDKKAGRVSHDAAKQAGDSRVAA